jgi:energy-coupling factor transport system substrate-specific component
MKKLYIVLTVIVILILMGITLNQNIQSGFALIFTLGVFAILFLSYFYFEKSSLGTKEIGIIATLSAFSAVSRVIFALIPNVQPVTFLVALSGYVFGPYQGFLIGSSAAFLSNIFLGQGPWTPWQMFSWGIIGMICGFWGKKNQDVSPLKFAIACFAFGFMFDWIMNFWNLITFVKPITKESIIVTYLSSLTFDILHGLGNFTFSIIFYDILRKVLFRYKRRLEVTYIQEGDLL